MPTDGKIDIHDLALLLTSWGECTDGATTTTTTTTATTTTTTPTTTIPPTSAGAVSTAAAVAGAAWLSHVTVTVDASSSTWNYVSDGLPRVGTASKYVIPTGQLAPPFTDGNGNVKDGQTYDIVDASAFLLTTPADLTITTTPVYSEATTPTSLGAIGVTIGGVSINNDYENMELTAVALDDNFIIGDAYFVDTCNGHPLTSGTGYHYHGIPYCLTSLINTAGQHSRIVGFLLDGFPLYGNEDAAGVLITNNELDECSGHFGPTPEFPQGVYHYHLTADEAPYSVDCYHGEIDASAIVDGMGPPDGGPGGGPAGGGPP